MMQESITDKTNRLFSLLDEAKKIIREIEEEVYDKCVANYNIELRNLDVDYPFLWTRFITACDRQGINTIGDLMKVPTWRFLGYQSVGEKSIKLAQKVLKEKYNVTWN